jgi:hypothetical protein
MARYCRFDTLTIKLMTNRMVWISLSSIPLTHVAIVQFHLRVVFVSLSWYGMQKHVCYTSYEELFLSSMQSADEQVDVKRV